MTIKILRNYFEQRAHSLQFKAFQFFLSYLNYIFFLTVLTLTQGSEVPDMSIPGRSAAWTTPTVNCEVVLNIKCYNSKKMFIVFSFEKKNI